MRIPKLAVAALIACSAVLAGSLTALAVTGTTSSHLDSQAAKWTTTTATTSSTTFHTIPGLSGLNVCALHQVTATLSAELAGAPAAFQVQVDSGATMHPGTIRFLPAALHDSASFTFVQSVGTFEANDHHVFDVSWRSPSGKAVTLERGTLVLQYAKGTHGC